MFPGTDSCKDTCDAYDIALTRLIWSNSLNPLPSNLEMNLADERSIRRDCFISGVRELLVSQE